MPYFDLNVPYSANSAQNKAFVSTATSLGFDAIAFNHTVTKKLSPSDTCSIKPVELDSPSADSVQSSCIRLPPESGTGSGALKQLTRLTLHLDDTALIHTLNPTNPVLRSYDLFAVRPTSEKAFQAACLQLDGLDIISLDASQRLPFMLRRQYVVGALARGVVFELSFGAALREPSSRKHLVNNALSLLRFSGGKGLILTSDAAKPIEMRSPADAINLCLLLGVPLARAKAALSSSCASTILHGETRRTLKGVLKTDSVASLPPSLAWQLPAQAALDAKRPGMGGGTQKRKIESKEAEADDDDEDDEDAIDDVSMGGVTPRASSSSSSSSSSSATASASSRKPASTAKPPSSGKPLPASSTDDFVPL